MTNFDDVKKLRELTGAGILECKQTLTDNQGDFTKALELLKKKGVEVAEKKKDRITRHGLIETYSHNNGQVVSVVEVLCETDFVARNDDFKIFCHEIAMQVAAMEPRSVEDLLQQTYIRDSGLTIDQLHKNLVGKIRENILINRIARFELGE